MRSPSARRPPSRGLLTRLPHWRSRPQVGTTAVTRAARRSSSSPESVSASRRSLEARDSPRRRPGAARATPHAFPLLLRRYEEQVVRLPEAADSWRQQPPASTDKPSEPTRRRRLCQRRPRRPCLRRSHLKQAESPAQTPATFSASISCASSTFERAHCLPPHQRRLRASNERVCPPVVTGS